MECAGIADILTKSLGSTNPHNMVRATMDGLQPLTTVEQIARERGVEAGLARLPVARQREGGGLMARTFVWHPGKGPKQTPKNELTEGKVAHPPGAERHRSFLAHARGRSRRSGSSTTRTR